jgi:hypothetical protein
MIEFMDLDPLTLLRAALALTYDPSGRAAVRDHRRP